MGSPRTIALIVVVALALAAGAVAAVYWVNAPMPDVAPEFDPHAP